MSSAYEKLLVVLFKLLELKNCYIEFTVSSTEQQGIISFRLQYFAATRIQKVIIVIAFVARSSVLYALTCLTVQSRRSGCSVSIACTALYSAGLLLLSRPNPPHIRHRLMYLFPCPQCIVQTQVRAFSSADGLLLYFVMLHN